MQSRRPYKTPKQPAGIGCHVDLSSGRISINFGLSSQRIIIEGEQSTSHNSDPVVRGPIPNERMINQHKSKLRSISYSGEGSQARMPSSLPFKPSGLQWKGTPSVTTRQLLEQQEVRKSIFGRIGEPSAPTT